MEIQVCHFNKYVEQNHCPLNDWVCDAENVNFKQNILLGTRSDMDDIIIAIQKVYDNADKINARLG